MNHKEALQKIVDVLDNRKGFHITTNELKIRSIAISALQSESMMYSREDVLDLLCDYADLIHSTKSRKPLQNEWLDNWEKKNNSQSLQPKTEEVKEGLKPCPNHPDVLTSQCGICNGTFPKLEQPTSPSIEKMAEEYDKDEFKRITGHNNHEEMRAYEEGREHEQITILKWIENWDGSTNSVMGELLHKKLKANNSLLELENWVKANFMGDIPTKILSKIQQLKNLKP